jgi:hypothetical protein
MMMGRPCKRISQERALTGELPLRQHWQGINRVERAKAKRTREMQKVRDQRRPTCRCEAYPWPHRPKGGNCRYPDPPAAIWTPKYEWKYRPYKSRYQGIAKQIARASGLHPIKHRRDFQELIQDAVRLAKELKGKNSRVKFRNMQISELERTPAKSSMTVTGTWTTAGPTM